MPMKIGIIQSDVSLGEPFKNVSHIEELIGRLFSFHKPDIVILPELWYTGYDYGTIYKNTMTDEEVLNLIKKWQNLYPALWIPGSFPILEDGKIYNRTYAISPNGEILAKYDKLHLFGPMSEKRYFSPGNRIVTFEYNGIVFGLSICYDLRFPELFRLLALKGARVIFLPTEWPTPRIAHFEILMHARAVENQVFMVGVNRVGKDSMSEFSGHSLVIDPWGKNICALGEKEDVSVCDIDLSLVDRVRKKIPLFSDRRDDVYRLKEV
ncbi:MAG TPA: carbon-nitrogen family hydrolase [Candidatus Atribacteria bacterium]|nr:carbon-nitrogen family hydrolase [Candidatus Atribacteria bacterium]